MENRINEIIRSISAFGKEEYYKDELLNEYLKLQQEIVNLTFNNEHAEKSDLRLWDVENHFEDLNERLGHPADDELQTFKNDSKEVCNAIKREYSGKAGENKVFFKLEALRSKKFILKNIELNARGNRTEIDAIVLTEKGVFVIEVKNTRKDIFIDENGDYYRMGRYQRLDCNLGEKMSMKNLLLKDALETKFSKNLNIVNIIVFTNNNMQVHNTSKCLQTCFLSMLPHMIDNYTGESVYSDEDLSTLKKAIESAAVNKAYPPDIDVEIFKKNFAILMTTLERASIDEDVEESDEFAPEDNNEYINNSECYSEAACDGVHKLPFIKRKSIIIPALAGIASFLVGLLVPHLADLIKHK